MNEMSVFFYGTFEWVVSHEFPSGIFRIISYVQATPDTRVAIEFA